MGRLPDFLVIGALKAGTTSLHFYLKQHPAIYMAEPKETRFFAYDAENPDHRAKVPRVFPVTSLEQYRSLFAGAGPDQLAGEASPQYLNSPIAAARIKEVMPEARLIVSLRNPVESIYSSWLMDARAGGTSRDLEEDARREAPWLKSCFYYEKLARFWERFDPRRIKVILFDEFKREPVRTMQEVYAFLGVDAAFAPDTSQVHNRGGLPRHRALHKLLTNSTLRRRLAPLLPERVRRRASALRQANLVRPPEPSRETRERLAALYAEDVNRLGTLIGRDLSHWHAIG